MSTVARGVAPASVWMAVWGAAWRIVLFLFVTGAATWVALLLLSPLGDAGRTAGQSPVPYWAQCLGLLAATAFMLRVVDKRPWSDVWMGRESWRPRALLSGSAIGTLAIAIPAAMLLAAGWLVLVATPDASWWAATGRMLLLLVPAALLEELLVRGYAFQRLRGVVGTWWTLAVSSALFALAHAQNPGVSLRALLIVMLAGLWLGLVLVKARSLPAAWLAHLAWNAALAVGFHAVLSGEPLETPDYRMLERGPDWLTGGPWGPEGGAGAVLGIGGAIGYLIARRGRREEHTT